MYSSVCEYSDYIDQWFRHKAGKLMISDYQKLIENVRNHKFGVKIKFGLEVCYFTEYEEFIANCIKNKDLDFVVGSVHFVDNFAFDHISEHWKSVNIDKVYKSFFESSISLAKSGIYDGIAHPDSIKLFGHLPSFSLTEYYDLLAENLASNGMYAEQNSGVYRRTNTAELGMDKNLLHTMKTHGVTIITASDAHCPEDVGALIPNMCKQVSQVY